MPTMESARNGFVASRRIEPKLLPGSVTCSESFTIFPSGSILTYFTTRVGALLIFLRLMITDLWGLMKNLLLYECRYLDGWIFTTKVWFLSLVRRIDKNYCDCFWFVHVRTFVWNAYVVLLHDISIYLLPVLYDFSLFLNFIKIVFFLFWFKFNQCYIII